MAAVASQVTRAPRRFRVLAALAVCALVALTFVVIRFRTGTGPVLPEVARNAVEWRAGRWYLKGQTNALTGWLVEHYETGTLKARSLVSNGWLDGISEGWHTNGQRQVEEHFRAGVSHGQRLKWNADGSKLSEAQIVDGKLHGTFRRWHPDGTLAEEVELQAGQPEGLSRAYFPSGFLKAEARLRAGKVLEQKFWSDGERKELSLLANGPSTGQTN